MKYDVRNFKIRQFAANKYEDLKNDDKFRHYYMHIINVRKERLIITLEMAYLGYKKYRNFENRKNIL